jgi:hypothetical protein
MAAAVTSASTRPRVRATFPVAKQQIDPVAPTPAPTDGLVWTQTAQTASKPFPTRVLFNKRYRLSSETQKRLETSLGFAAVFLALSLRGDQGVGPDEWSTLLPDKIDYRSGFAVLKNVVDTWGTLLIHPTRNADCTKHRVSIEQRFHELDWKMAQARVAELKQRRDTLDRMEATCLEQELDVHDPALLPFRFENMLWDTTPYQYTFQNCEFRKPFLIFKPGDRVSLLWYDYVVRVIRFVRV